MLLSEKAVLVIRDLIARSSDRLVSFPVDYACLRTELIEALPKEWRKAITDPQSVPRDDCRAFSQFCEQASELGMLSGLGDESFFA